MKEDNIRYFKCQFTQQIALCNFDVFILASNCTPSSGGWSKALLALLAPLKVWHLTKFWDDRG